MVINVNWVVLEGNTWVLTMATYFNTSALKKLHLGNK